MAVVEKRVVPVIVGPTAVGKTDLAVALAAIWPVVVVSADSRQIYRRLDIGTAKPDSKTLNHVKHFGIDVVDLGERYSAGRFAADASRWIETIPADKVPVVVGGTGLYIKALFDGLLKEPEMDLARRDLLRRWTTTLPNLDKWAARLDPVGVSGGGRQRASRVVEVALLTGWPLSWWQTNAHQGSAVQPWYVRISVPRAILRERIQERTRRMLADGWIGEVRGLMASGGGGLESGLDAVGYREIVRHLGGNLSRNELETAIVVATRRYAKRQETWFRHQLKGPVFSVDGTGEVEDLAQAVVKRWEEDQG